MKILDASAGLRSMWFDKNDSQTIYLDIREEVKPSVIADAKQLPFKDGTFDLVLFDPPHTSTSSGSIFSKKYGSITAAQIVDLVLIGSKEIARVTKVNGFMIFKWNTHHIKLDRILRLVSHGLKPLFGHHTAYRTKHSSQTFWICYKKSPKLPKA